MKKKIHNIETNEIILVDMTVDEIEANESFGNQIKKEQDLVASAKAAAEAKLAALGLNAEDLKALGL